MNIPVDTFDIFMFIIIIGLVIWVVRLKGKIKQLSLQVQFDPLTGLLLRKPLEQELKKLRALLPGGPGDQRVVGQGIAGICILFIDVDYFKRINDTYGHAVGDTVLKRVAATLRHSLRESDYISRYGGEEFVVVLPNTLTDQAKVVAENVRRAVSALQVLDLEQQVTVSIGVACACTQAQAKLDSFISSADVAMYQAKTQGRDRVVVSSE